MKIKFADLVEEAQAKGPGPLIVELPDGDTVRVKALTGEVFERLVSAYDNASGVYEMSVAFLAAVFGKQWKTIKTYLDAAPLEATYQLANQVSSHFFAELGVDDEDVAEETAGKVFDA